MSFAGTIGWPIVECSCAASCRSHRFEVNWRCVVTMPTLVERNAALAMRVGEPLERKERPNVHTRSDAIVIVNCKTREQNEQMKVMRSGGIADGS
jgi:hypothetical protein